jgi:hypothetical protein
MKIRRQLGKKNQGGALLVTVIVVAGIAAITIISYLRLVQSEYTTVARSQTWSGAMALAEAGVEDALAMLNKYAGTPTSLTNWANTATSDGWTQSGNVFHISRTNGNFGYYDVYVTNVVNGTDFTPTILSIGKTFWKLPGPSLGDGAVAASYSEPAVRKVFVKTMGDSSASGGLTAQYVMDFNGNQCTVDSYNSADPTASYWHSTWFMNGRNFGTYTNTLRTASVVVGTDGTLLNAGGVNIYGYVNTGPGGTVAISSGGTVGDLNWIGPDPAHPYNFGIQPGHKRDDMNIQFPPVSVPTPASWRSVPAPTASNIFIAGQTYSYTNVSGVSGYQIGGVVYSLVITNINGNPGTTNNPIYYQYYGNSGQLQDAIFIDATNVVLYLPGGINFNNSKDNLTVNTNANVTIYSNADIDTGNGLVNNFFQYADALKIYGTPNCQNISFGGNAALTINLYAPSADVTFNGGGSTTYDVCGQIKVSNIKVNGKYNFHFDEVLKVISPPTHYLPNYWQEVF